MVTVRPSLETARSGIRLLFADSRRHLPRNGTLITQTVGKRHDQPQGLMEETRQECWSSVQKFMITESRDIPLMRVSPDAKWLQTSASSDKPRGWRVPLTNVTRTAVQPLNGHINKLESPQYSTSVI